MADGFKGHPSPTAPHRRVNAEAFESVLSDESAEPDERIAAAVNLAYLRRRLAGLGRTEERALELRPRRD